MPGFYRNRVRQAEDRLGEKREKGRARFRRTPTEGVDRAVQFSSFLK